MHLMKEWIDCASVVSQEFYTELDFPLVAIWEETESSFGGHIKQLGFSANAFCY